MFLPITTDLRLCFDVEAWMDEGWGLKLIVHYFFS